jgi:hypothetical protein
MARRIREVSVQEQANPEPIVARTVRQSAGGPIVHAQDEKSKDK